MGRCSLIGSIVAALLAVAPVTAHAQQGGDNEAFKAYVTSPAYKTRIKDLVVASEKMIAPDCQDIAPVERANLTIYKDILISGGHPAGGLWGDRIKMRRCGQATLQSVMFQAASSFEEPRAQVMAPGDTKANPALQAVIMAEMAKRVMEAGCRQQFMVTGTAVSQEIVPITIGGDKMIKDGEWIEAWQLRACDRPLEIFFRLIVADGNIRTQF